MPYSINVEISIVECLGIVITIDPVSEDGAFEHAGNAGTFVRVDPNRELIVVMMTRCGNARIPGNEFVGFVENAVTDAGM